MPRGVFNWCFSDVERFLKDNGFRLNHSSASHYFYTGKANGAFRQVCVPFHGSKKTFKPKTLNGMILQSGIDRKDWLK